MSLVTGITKDYQGDVDLDPNSRTTVAVGGVGIYVNALTGNDNNPGTLALPLQTFDAAISRVPSGNRSQLQINLAAGDYNWTKKNIFMGNAVDNEATPLAIVGALSNDLGTVTAAAGSTTTLLNFAAAGIRNGAVASFIAGAALGNIRITGLTGMVASDVDRLLLISGAATAANNGPFTIAAFVDAATVDLVNAQGVIADANNSAIGWQESFEGCYVQFASNTTSPALQNVARQIRGNPSTAQFLMATAFPAVPAAGDTFIVQRPASVIHYGAAGDAATVAYVWDSGTLGLQGVKFKRDAGNAGLTFRLTQNQFESVWVQNGVLLVTNYSVIPAGQSSAVAQWANQTVTSPFSATRQGCGVFLQDISTGVMLTNHCRMVGTCVAINTNFVISQDAFFSPTLWGDRCSVVNTGGEIACPAGGINKQQSPSLTTGIITAQMGGMVTLPSFDLSNSGGYGLDLQNGSEGRLGAVTSAAGANAKSGIRVDHRSGVSINSPAGVTSVTGATDVEFGHTTVPNTQSYFAINAVDVNGVKGFQDTYGNRVDAN